MEFLQWIVYTTAIALLILVYHCIKRNREWDRRTGHDRRVGDREWIGRRKDDFNNALYKKVKNDQEND